MLESCRTSRPVRKPSLLRSSERHDDQKLAALVNLSAPLSHEGAVHGMEILHHIACKYNILSDRKKISSAQCKTSATRMKIDRRMHNQKTHDAIKRKPSPRKRSRGQMEQKPEDGTGRGRKISTQSFVNSVRLISTA